MEIQHIYYKKYTMWWGCRCSGRVVSEWTRKRKDSINRRSSYYDHVKDRRRPSRWSSLDGTSRLSSALFFTNDGSILSWSKNLVTNTRRDLRCPQLCMFYTKTATVSTVGDETDDRFLQQIQATIDIVIQHYDQTYNIDIVQKDDTTMKLMFDSKVPPSEREVINIVRYLDDRIQRMKQQNICRRCWYPKPKYCICATLQPMILPKYIQQIYILAHYKEIGLMIDTMKLLLCAYPNKCQLVVGGISEQYQTSMRNMSTLIQEKENHNIHNNTKTLVLFPSTDAITFPTYYEQQRRQQHGNIDGYNNNSDNNTDHPPMYNIIVIDATWEQARRLYHRHIMQSQTSSSPASNQSLVHIQLSETSLQSLHQRRGLDGEPQPDGTIQKIMMGQQLRPHPLSVREIATAHAVQLLLRDMTITTTTTTIDDGPPVREGHPDQPMSLQLHHQQQQQQFDQYQQLAMDTALKVKKWGTTTTP
jgi:DTW domain-containing protein YfiP